MRPIIPAKDSAFRRTASWMTEDEFNEDRRNRRHGNGEPDIEDHEEYERARRMGFRPTRDQTVKGPPRIYKIDKGGTVTNILATPLTNIESEDSGPQWVTTMHNFGEYPEIRAMHNTFADALDAQKDRTWATTKHHVPVDYQHDEMRANPGVWYQNKPNYSGMSDVPFQEAWDAGTDDPFDRKYRKWANGDN